MESVYIKLKKLASNFSLLYVEDNEGLRKKATQYFQKFFSDVIVAADGEEGLELFKKYRPQIVITDIKMPRMNGLKMLSAIKKIDPQVKAIVSSAYNEVDLLHKSIDLGVYHYMVKPINTEKMIKLLIHLLEDIEMDKNRMVFENYMDNIFNSQNDLLLLIEDKKLLLANDTAIEFFSYDSLKDFQNAFDTFEKYLQPHENFLYNHDDIEWLDEIYKDLTKLHHVKMIINEKIYHFILKVNRLKNSDTKIILSFEDITELHLLELFDKKSFDADQKNQNTQSILKLVEVLKDNATEIKVYNLYKGLSITNKAVVIDVKEQSIVLKTTFLQQKAIEIEKRVTLASEVFPAEVVSKSVDNNDFDKQIVEVSGLSFNQKGISNRDYIRLVPDAQHHVTLFFEERKFDTDIKIMDISVKAMRLHMALIPAGFSSNEFSERVDIVLNLANKKRVLINCAIRVHSIEEHKDHFEVVVVFETDENIRKNLVSYIAQRQMELVREFKGFQYAQ